MENDNGDFVPITLEIDDNRKFGYVAFLVDREDFLNDIRGARKTLGINKLISYKDINTWISQEYENTLKKYPKKKPTISGGVTSFSVPLTSLDAVVHELYTKYKRPTYMSFVIESVILSGKVTNYEIEQTAYCRIIAPKVGFNEPMLWPELAIVISPHTTIQEIEELFKTRVPELFQEYSDFFGYLPPDTISNIKRDRDWYWQHQNGFSYQKVWEATTQNLRPADRDGVIKAIKQYRERLAVEL